MARIRLDLIGDRQLVVAKKVKISQSRLSKLEGGHLEATESDYMAYLKAYPWLSPAEFFTWK